MAPHPTTAIRTGPGRGRGRGRGSAVRVGGAAGVRPECVTLRSLSPQSVGPRSNAWLACYDCGRAARDQLNDTEGGARSGLTTVVRRRRHGEGAAVPAL